MRCITNLERINYPKELVHNLTELYTFKGKDFYYEDVLKQYMNQIIKNTVEKDVIASAKILNLDVNDNRLKLIVKKNSEPKTKHEKIVRNLKVIFEKIQEQGTELNLTSNEFVQLGDKLFKDVVRFDYVSDIITVKENLLDEKKKVSRRAIVDDEIKDYVNAKLRMHVEATQVITNFYVDLINLKCFNLSNEFMSLIITYCLLFMERFNVFKYVSFFEYYLKNISEFKKLEQEASFGWENGYAKTAALNTEIIKCMLDGYQKVEKMVSDLEFDKRMRKVDNVESVIMKLGDTFSREDIKNKVPTLSDSTINRALVKLRNEGKIRPDGTGRSAKWIRLVPDEMFTSNTMQLNIFNFIKNEEDK